MRNAVPLLFLGFLGASLLSACELASSSYIAPAVVVAPELEAYSPEFQGRMADELDTMAEACDPLDPNPTCSAVARAILDYGELRARVRAMEGGH
ncbi:hypothetical protein [uncultured Rhodospira sp.]|uniref:hypothetical protein n=1 Tax=uncultured Rhodospira sp. TaxID=1936189 RepID=UPI002616ED5B|nr:hypothetical protein [uncultured Rhodospira sp.]